MLKHILLLTLISFIACGGTLNSQARPVVDRQPVQKRVKVCPDSVYFPIIDSLKKYYDGHRFSYNKGSESSKFVYSFMPISLFPFYCMDTVVDNAGKISLFFENSYSINSYQNQYGSICAEVAVVFYTTDAHHAIYKKTYRLHSFIYNEATCQWSKYQKPIDIIFKASEEEKGAFEPVVIVKR